MLKLLRLAVVLTLTVALNAHAYTVTYNFSGSLYDIRESGAHLSFGTKFVGTYQYDDTPTSGAIIEPNRAGFANQGVFSVAAAGRTFNGNGWNELQVFDDYTSAYSGYFNDDGFFVSSWQRSPVVSYLIQFDLWDFAGATLNDLSKPSQAQVQELARNGRVWIREFVNGAETGLAGGYFSSFDPVRQGVAPEPPMLALTLVGLLSVWQRQRSKQRHS